MSMNPSSAVRLIEASVSEAKMIVAREPSPLRPQAAAVLVADQAQYAAMIARSIKGRGMQGALCTG